MEPTTQPHPLVAKAAQKWVDLATKYGVATTVTPIDSGHFASGLIVTIETGSNYDSASIQIFPPMRAGRTVRQSPLYLTYYRKRGRLTFGRRPGTTLRTIGFYIANIWCRDIPAADQ